jgi:BON domain
MQMSELSERVEATILEPVLSDDELENRVRSLLRWKIRFNAVDVAVASGHVTLSGQVISALDRETAEQTTRRLTGVVGVTNCIMASPTGPGCANGGQNHHQSLAPQSTQSSRRAVGALPVQRLKA